MQFLRRVSVIALAATSQPAIASPINGFGDVEFGMSVADVIRLGFECKPGEKGEGVVCNSSAASGDANSFVVRHPKAFEVALTDVSVSFDPADKADSISLGFAYESCDQVRRNASNAFAQLFNAKELDPTQFENSKVTGWNFDNGTAMLSKVSIGNNDFSVKFCPLMIIKAPSAQSGGSLKH